MPRWRVWPPARALDIERGEETVAERTSNQPPGVISEIDPQYPVFGSPLTATVRANFEAAKEEIEDLYRRIAELTDNPLFTQGALLLTGGTMSGAINWVGPPVDDKHLTNKEYVDQAVASGQLYQGTYDAATNVPDLEVTANQPDVNGGFFIVSVAGTIPITVPGFAVATPVNVGDHIVWNDTLGEFSVIAAGGMSQADADLRYLQLAGGTMATNAILTMGSGYTPTANTQQVATMNALASAPFLPLASLPLSLANGGTGATDAAGARTQLGIVNIPEPAADGVWLRHRSGTTYEWTNNYTRTTGFGSVLSFTNTVSSPILDFTNTATAYASAIQVTNSSPDTANAGIRVTALASDATAVRIYSQQSGSIGLWVSRVAAAQVSILLSGSSGLGEIAGDIRFRDASQVANNASIIAINTQAHNATNRGTRLEFEVTPNGTTISQTALILDHDRSVTLWDGTAMQPIGIGSVNPTSTYVIPARAALIPEPSTAGNFLRTDTGTWVPGLPLTGGTMTLDSGNPLSTLVFLTNNKIASRALQIYVSPSVDFTESPGLFISNASPNADSYGLYAQSSGAGGCALIQPSATGAGLRINTPPTGTGVALAITGTGSGARINVGNPTGTATGAGSVNVRDGYYVNGVSIGTGPFLPLSGGTLNELTTGSGPRLSVMVSSTTGDWGAIYLRNFSTGASSNALRIDNTAAGTGLNINNTGTGNSLVVRYGATNHFVVAADGTITLSPQATASLQAALGI